jgi:hypothetical protein
VISVLPFLVLSCSDGSAPTDSGQGGLADIASVSLTVQSAAPAGELRAGDTLRISYSYRNEGAANIPASAVNRVYLSKDGMVSDDDVLLGNVSTEAVGPDIKSSGSASFQVPLALSETTYQVVLALDATNLARETNESNNSSAAAAGKFRRPEIAFGAGGTFLTYPDGIGVIKAGPGRSPTWSPDHSEIAFSGTDQNGQADIYVMNADGTNVRNITNDAMYDREPAWRPTGRELPTGRSISRVLPIHAVAPATSTL